jgi:hypothetical protein
VKLAAAITAPLTAVKTLRKMIFRRDTWRWIIPPDSQIDFAREVGDGTRSSTVAATLNWIANTFPEAPPTLWQHGDEEEKVIDHPMLRLLQQPNA